MQGTYIEMEPAHARAMLQISQAYLAEKSGVAINTIITWERGEAIFLTKAYAILKGLNAVRQEQSMDPLRFDDIQWKTLDRNRTRNGPRGKTKKKQE